MSSVEGRAHQLADADAGLNFALPFFVSVFVFVFVLGRLPLRIAADVARGVFDRVLQFRMSLLPSLVEIRFGNTEWVVLA
jgi:hypothetical protein